MSGLATGMREAGIGALILLASAVVAVSLLFASVYVFSERAGRGVRLKTAVRKLGIGLGLVFLVSAAGSYYRDAGVRAAATRFHTVRSDADRGMYTAQYAYLGADHILLRVYQTSDMSLLAERTYAYPDAARLVWTKDSLIYDTASESGGEIRLPPSLYDWLAARLP
jgi:hypothetical protein